MKGDLITSEDDVRAWVREASGGKARWVEPALGSTPGLPDCWVPCVEGGRAITAHAELKAGELVDGWVKYKVRPEQKKQIKAMLADGMFVGLVIGIKGTSACIFCYPTTQILGGKAKIDDEKWMVVDVRTPGAFWAGVYSIILNAPLDGRIFDDSGRVVSGQK